MRRKIWMWMCLLLIAATGCQSVEVAVSHPLTGVHVVAKFQACDQGRAADEESVQSITL
jgi:hypothetical protein